MENTTKPRVVTKADESDTSCGIGCFRSKWLQRLACKESFLFVFCLTSVFQGMYFTYFVSVVTTLEKLYHIPSKAVGMVLASGEVGQISGSLFLTYYGSSGNRPRWIGYGVMLFSISVFFASSPHFIFDSHSTSNLTITVNAIEKSCLDDGFTEKCSTSDEIDESGNDKTLVLLIFSFCSVMIGVGSTAITNLGVPFIDDNISPKESPIYFGITIGVRIFGPVFGFILGAICTNIYITFPVDGPTSITPLDPKWVGAWWMGLFVIGFSLFLVSLTMMSFPRRLPRPDPNSHSHSQQNGNEKINRSLLNDEDIDVRQSKIRPINAEKNENKCRKNEDEDEIQVRNTVDGERGGFTKTMKRLLKNEFLVCRTASNVLHMLPVSGVYSFLPKYLESHFQVTASKANMLTGIAGIMIMGVGIFFSGLVIRKFNPNPRLVALWTVIASTIYFFGMVFLMYLECPMGDFVSPKFPKDTGYSTFKFGRCNNPQTCYDDDFNPICVNYNGKNLTFLSPSLLSCKTEMNENKTISYSDCQCADELLSVGSGLCQLDCTNLIWYISVFSFMVLIHSTTEVGSMLLTLRCVEPDDKAMALGLVSFSTSLFSSVPCSIIYGSMIDSTCIFWESICEKTGACRLYDKKLFRLYFHGLTAAFMFMATIIDFIVWHKSKHIDFCISDNADKSQSELSEENDPQAQVADQQSNSQTVNT